VLIFLDTGIRVSELADLTLENVNLDHMQLKVYGKGSKERTVPIGVRVQRAIWKYLQQYRPDPASPRFTTLFLTKDGKPVTKGRIETQIKRYEERAGITGVRCSPHTFRHTFATSYLRNGGNVFSLQRILGHSSLETTMVYINLAQTDVQDAHRRYSPADNIDLTRKAGNSMSEKQRCRQRSRRGR
jgi:integrase/recombinase XerD